MNPILSQNSYARVKGNIENESCSTTWVNQKTVVEPYSDPKSSTLGPQEDKSDRKEQMSELKETNKMKVVQIHEKILKYWSNPTPTPKIAN